VFFPPSPLSVFFPPSPLVFFPLSPLVFFPSSPRLVFFPPWPPTAVLVAVGYLNNTHPVTNISCNQCEVHTSAVSCVAVGNSSTSSSLGKGDVASPRSCELFYCGNCNTTNEPSVVRSCRSGSPSSESEERAGRVGAFLATVFDLCRPLAVTHGSVGLYIYEK